MERNLNRRVELLFPLENPEHIQHIRADVLDTYLHDTQLAYVMQADGKYQRKKTAVGEEPVNVQNLLMRARRKA